MGGGHARFSSLAKCPGITPLVQVTGQRPTNMSLLERWVLPVPDFLKLPTHLRRVLPGPQEGGLPEEDNTSAY